MAAGRTDKKMLINISCLVQIIQNNADHKEREQNQQNIVLSGWEEGYPLDILRPQRVTAKSQRIWLGLSARQALGSLLACRYVCVCSCMYVFVCGLICRSLYQYLC